MTQRLLIAFIFGTTLIRVALIAGPTHWGFEDVEAYWQAALRLREGQPLYPVGIDPDSYAVFRYTPWFAWLWVPLTDLDRTVVEWAWAAALAAASIAVLVALAQLRTAAAFALAMIITPWLLSLVQVGNIQPLVVAMLAFGVSRASGPVWVAISASLKVVPIMYALVYFARREWARLGIAVGLTALLSAPILLYDLQRLHHRPGRVLLAVLLRLACRLGRRRRRLGRGGCLAGHPAIGMALAGDRGGGDAAGAAVAHHLRHLPRWWGC